MKVTGSHNNDILSTKSLYKIIMRGKVGFEDLDIGGIDALGIRSGKY